ncbi:STAS domain-containing protein [Kitasatospora sp. NPDC057223]|uniref:STAS domain-containing protein n=1 Tax=Kitasatospora sp. NPDC057223 TaxID=3346055 RepID=UPI003644F57C
MSLTKQAVAALPAASTPEPVDQGLSIHRRDRRLGTTLTLSGEIDLDTAPQLDRAVRECLRTGVGTIDLDLAPLTFCDVRGLHAFIDATWLAAAAGGRLRLENLPPMLHRILTLTGTHHLVTTGTDEVLHNLALARPGMSAGTRPPAAPGRAA